MSLRRGELYWVAGTRRAARAGGPPPRADRPDRRRQRQPPLPQHHRRRRQHVRPPVATHVPLAPSARNGLSAASYVKCEQILTLSKDRLQGGSARSPRTTWPAWTPR